MTDPYYLTDGAHVLISGATGAGDRYGGKSVLGNWWTQKYVKLGWGDVGLFYNPKRLGYVRGQAVTSLSGLAQSYRSGYRLFDYRPPDGGSEDSHGDVVEFLRNIPGEKIMAHDEAQSYKGAESLNWCLSQGGNMNQSGEPTGDIRSLVITQRPWNLGENLRANMPLKVWVGPFGNEARNFFQSEQMEEAGRQVRKNTGPYRWSVTDGGEFVTTHEPVPEEYA